MAYVKAQLSVPQIEDVNGNPASGYTINSYIWDTSTPTPMYTSSAGAGSATSFTLNSLGQPQSAGGTAVDIFLDSAITYKFIIRDASSQQVGPTIGPVTAGSADTYTVIATGTTSARSLADYFGDFPTPMNYSATGDGVDDDLTHLEDWIADNSGNWVMMAGKTFAISDTLTINVPIKIIGYGAKIVYTGASNTTPVIEITSSNVSIYGLEVQGLPVDSATTERLGSHLIYAHGVDNEGSLAAPTYINDVHVIDCKLHDTKRTAVFYEFVDRGSVQACEIHDVQYAGIEGLSCNRIRVIGNHIRAVGASSAVIGDNAYGVTFGRQVNAGTTLTTHPPSKYWLVANNMINGVASWEGIDTHGGYHSTIIGNQIRNVNMGIVVTRDKNATTEINAPKYIAVVGNTIETISQPDNAAIIVAGAAGASVGLTNDFAYGIAVSGNTIEYGGDYGDTTGRTGGIYARNTYGLIVQGNNLHKPYNSGVCLEFDNYGFMVGANNIFDPYGDWANACGISVRDQCNEGTIDRNNVYRQNTALGTYVAIYSTYVQTATNCNLRLHDGFDNTLNGSLTAAAAMKSSPRRSEIKEVSVAADTGSYTTDVTWTFDKPYIDAKITATYKGNPYSGANAIGVAVAGFTTSGGKQVSCTVRFYLPSTAMTFSAGTLTAFLEASET